MTSPITSPVAAATSAAAASTTTPSTDLLLGDNWHSRIETEVRDGVRALIEGLLAEELAAALGRQRYKRLKPATTATSAPAESPAGLGDEVEAAPARPARARAAKGHRNGTRTRAIIGTFGAVEVAVPRARLDTDEPGKTTEWQNKTIERYRRRTKEVDALIAGAYLSGTNTRRAPHASGMTCRTCAGRAVQGRDFEVGGQPSVAQDQGGLGQLEQQVVREMRGRRRLARRSWRPVVHVHAPAR